MLVSPQSAQSQIPTASQVYAGSTSGAELCIICDGAPSLAVGSVLSQSGHKVRLWPIKETAKTLSAFMQRVPLEMEIRPRGSAAVAERARAAFSIVSHDPAVSLRGAEGVVVCQPLTEYGALVNLLSTQLINGQTVCLCNAPIGAALEFKQLMRRRNKELQINVIEIGNLFDCARLENGTLLISGQRDKVSFCGVTRNETRRGLSIANTISSGLVPTSNVLERGLSEVEHIIRPVLLLFALLGGRDRELNDLSTVINPTLTKLVASLDREIQSLARTFHVVVPGFFESLTHFGGVGWDDADTLSQALISISQNMFDQYSATGPLCSRTAVEALKRDITQTFTVLYDFARLARMHMPVLNSVIELSEVVTQSELQKTGRSLSSLGLFGLDIEEIIELINA